MWIVPIALMLALPQVLTPTQLRHAGVISVESPTYFTDGEVRGAKAAQPLVLGQRVDFVVTAGHTLCQSMSALPTPPADAGYGWRLSLTVVGVGDDGSAKIHAVWRTAWDRGRVVDGPEHSSDLLLQRGGAAVLDYLRRGDSSDDVQCGALGMGLQIVMPRPDPDLQPLIEAELWLVKKGTDGTEEAQHQVVRFRGADPGEFFFDEITWPGSENAPQRVRVSGALLMQGIVDDKIALDFTARKMIVALTQGAGSTTRHLMLSPGEVTAFDLPMPGRSAAPGAIPAGTLSLRLRVRRIW